MPDVFGRFWLHEKIGQGGMAEIFRATVGPDPAQFAFDFVIKRMLPALQQDAVQRDMFLTEADLVSYLRHPNLVQVFESGLVGGQAYIAMERVWGFDLEHLVERLRRKRLRFPPDLAVYTAMQVLRALDYVHSARTSSGRSMELIHRDVTPSNIFVTYPGEVKLGDFGVARVEFIDSGEDAGVLRGKASYMPPEIFAGAQISQAVDLWSLAVSLYEILTTRRLYEGIAEDDLISGTARPKIVPANTLNPSIDAGLEKILEAALAKRPARRPEDALTFYRQLKGYLQAQAVRVDAQSLARFVRAVAGEPAAAVGGARGPNAGTFNAPNYQVPLGMTPTQRIELRLRRKFRVRPLWAVAGFAALLALGALVGRRLSLSPAHLKPTTPASEAAAPIIFGEESSTEFYDALGDAAEVHANVGAHEDKYAALIQKGAALARRRRFPAAIESYRSALEMRPSGVEAQLGEANALAELGRFAEAEAVALAARAVAPDRGHVFLVLGKIYRGHGQLDRARSAYRRCIELEPGSKMARVAQKALQSL